MDRGANRAAAAHIRPPYTRLMLTHRHTGRHLSTPRLRLEVRRPIRHRMSSNRRRLLQRLKETRASLTVKARNELARAIQALYEEEVAKMDHLALHDLCKRSSRLIQ